MLGDLADYYVFIHDWGKRGKMLIKMKFSTYYYIEYSFKWIEKSHYLIDIIVLFTYGSRYKLIID